MILAHGSTSYSDVEDLHYYAVKLSWSGSEHEKEIARKIKALINDYENACKIISTSDSLDVEMEA